MRELDAYLAEHVMELTRITELKHFKEGCFITNTDADVLVFDRNPSAFKPTTDPAAALAVLEKCKDVCIQYGCILNQWTVGTLSGDTYATAKALPLAIALFAKKVFSENQTPARIETAL